MEGVAETSEELMEKFFAEEPFTEEEIKTAIVSSIAKRDLMPVICGAINTDYGANILSRYGKIFLRTRYGNRPVRWNKGEDRRAS